MWGGGGYIFGNMIKFDFLIFFRNWICYFFKIRILKYINWIKYVLDLKNNFFCNLFIYDGYFIFEIIMCLMKYIDVYGLVFFYRNNFV